MVRAAPCTIPTLHLEPTKAKASKKRLPKTCELWVDAFGVYTLCGLKHAEVENATWIYGARQHSTAP